MFVTETIEDIAETIGEVLKNDRYVLVVISGETGEGKSCFASKLAKQVGNFTGVPFSYEDNMTYLRDEIKLWIDGEGPERKGQLPEYSAVLVDELISLFFKRNWYDDDQIDGIELFNKCRDRHLCIIGNIPNFQDLDSALFPLITFRIHIRSRGLAWMFKKDPNPWAKDPWHTNYNKKRYERTGDPSKCKGWVCAVYFDDWSDAEKEQYYAIRNKKRRDSEGQRAKKRREKEKAKRPKKYGTVKKQRDHLITHAYYECGVSYDELEGLTGLSYSQLTKITTDNETHG